METLLKLFYQQDCIRCPPAKEVCTKLIEKKAPVKILLYDISTIEGMTEAAFHEVIATPTTVLVDESENELKSWRGETPTIEEIENNINTITTIH